jgi:hypothetical protein
MAEIRSHNIHVEMPMQVDCQIACSTTKIESGPRSNPVFVYKLANFFDRDSTPSAIDGSGKKMIQEILTRGNLREHLPDGSSIRTLIDSGISRLSGLHPEFLSPLHGQCPRARRW